MNYLSLLLYLSIFYIYFPILSNTSAIFKKDLHKIIQTDPQTDHYKHTLQINVKNHDAGFFSWFKGIIGCLEYYEQYAHLFTNIHINLEGGPYADPNKEDNWWEYYFEPITTTNNVPKKHQKNTSTVSLFTSQYFAQMSLEACKKGFLRQRAAYLISKYIKIKEPIRRQINDFIDTHRFKDHFMIGIHYRGTDKACEAPSIKYQEIYAQIDILIKNNPIQLYKIFVATDEHAFLDHISRTYPNVIFIPQQRSTDGSPVHLGKQPVSPAQRGLEALTDCLLLSKCNVMIIKTQSNLSSAASDFNPHMPIILLNNPYPDLR